MPPLPTVRSASTAEPFAHHVGRTCHQGQNPKNHNRKASACLPIFFLFCLPFVCPFACPFFFHDCKKAFVFNGYNHVFVCPFACPSVLSQASWKAMAHNLKTRCKTCSLLVVCCSFVILLVGHRPACTSTSYGIRLLERILFVILFVGHSFRHAKYPTCVTNIQPCGSYGGQSYRQPQILFAQNSPYFALYVVFIFTPNLSHAARIYDILRKFRGKKHRSRTFVYNYVHHGWKRE